MSKRIRNSNRRRRTAQGFVVFGCALVWILATACGRAQTPSSHDATLANPNQIVFFSAPIVVPSAPIYASPSEKSYRTGAILKDRFVEIYFKTKNGFCAARPPYGSFSWLNAKFARMENETEARVVSPSGKPVPARVGGETPSSSGVVQVGLKNNQKVKVVGKATLQDGSTWLKIMPPPGEFRWIRIEAFGNAPAIEKLPEKLTTQAEYLRALSAHDEMRQNAQYAPTTNATSAPFAPPKTSDQPRDAAQTLPFPKEFAAKPLSEESPAQPAQPTTTNDEELILTLPEFDSNQGASLQLPPDLFPASREEDFDRKLAKLYADAFDAIRERDDSKPGVVENFDALQKRAEKLFENAPNDSQRFLVQAIFDALAKAKSDPPKLPDATSASIAPPALANATVVPQGAAEAIPNPVATPPQPQIHAIQNGAANAPQNGVVPPLDGLVVDGKFIPSRYAPGQMVDVSELPNGRFVNGQFVQDVPNAPLFRPIVGNAVAQTSSPQIDAMLANVPIAPLQSQRPAQSQPTRQKTASARGDATRSKMTFAFSGENSPFKREKTTNVAAREIPPALPALPALPNLFDGSHRLIVPPPDYERVPHRATALASVPQSATQSATENAAKLDANAPAQGQEIAVFKLESKATVEPTSDAILANASTATEKGDSAKKDDEKTSNDAPIDPTLVAQWAPEEEDDPSAKQEKFDLALAESKSDGKKIRQASAFAPVAANSAAHFDAAGTLVELDPDAEPRYALVDQTDEELKIVVYLAPGKGVSFDKFVGKRVAVRGASGTATVDGKTRKMIVVASVFLQK